jgi:hypothetical protein
MHFMTFSPIVHVQQMQFFVPSPECLPDITLRRADGVPLGLDLAQDGGQGLKVSAVHPHSTADAWNRRMRENGDVNRQIIPGDRLMRVNTKEEPKDMQDAGANDVLVRLKLVRDPQTSCPSFAFPATRSPEFEAAGVSWGQPPSTRRAVESADASDPSSADDVDITSSHKFTWTENARKLNGKCTRITKTQALEIGEFVFTIHAVKDSDERGGSSFQKAKGCGTVHVKCNSDTVRDVILTVSCGTDHVKVRHDFSTDCICRLPKTFNLASVVDARAPEGSGTFCLNFEFAQIRHR